jgi:protein-disulfide isomerase
MYHKSWFRTAIFSASVFLNALMPQVGAQTPITNESVAEVEGETITAEEVDKGLGAPLAKLLEQAYNLRRQKVDALIAEKLLAREAARRAMSVPALLDVEVTSKVALVTEQEIETYYRANKSRFQGDGKDIRKQVRTDLQNQKLTSQLEALIQSLRSQAKVQVHLKAPSVYRVEVSVDGAPFQGPVIAPVTIVEFSDFYCPYCKQVEPVLTQVLSRYGDNVKLVHKNFPLDSLHPTARQAAEAGQCANDQGKFWPYREKLYASGRDASWEKLEAVADDARLDLSLFGRCLSTRKHQTAVQKDIDEGIRLGVRGTPAFLINGRMLSGAQPLESFVRIIDEELARTP